MKWADSTRISLSFTLLSWVPTLSSTHRTITSSWYKVKSKNCAPHFESLEYAVFCFFFFPMNFSLCLETEFHSIIFSLGCQIQEDTTQVEVVKARAQKFGDCYRIWSEYNCFLTWVEGNILCMLVHRSLPMLPTHWKLPPTIINEPTCESKQSIAQVTVVSPFQQQNEKEKGNVFFIKLSLFSYQNQFQNHISKVSLNDSEIMFLLFGC